MQEIDWDGPFSIWGVFKGSSVTEKQETQTPSSPG